MQPAGSQDEAIIFGYGAADRDIHLVSRDTATLPIG
jgi:hypothetical protein